MTPFGRDYRGYGGRPPHPNWPEDARIAVSFVLNVEEGAELSLTAGDERNEVNAEGFAHPELVGVPDLCMESHFEYGSRAGYWRVADLFTAHDIPATASCSARVLEVSPWLGDDLIERGHEISAHSYRWESHAHLAEDEERAVIKRTVETIRARTGRRPIGWHTRSSSSAATRRLLVEEGGFLYDSNAYNDDLPYLVRVGEHDHVVLPYSFDTNDMRFGGGGFVFGEDFARYCIDAFDWLWREGTTAPKMMSIGLHLRTIGRPGRIGGLEALLEHMTAKGGVWFARREDIARHWRSVCGLPPWPEAT